MTNEYLEVQTSMVLENKTGEGTTASIRNLTNSFML